MAPALPPFDLSRLLVGIDTDPRTDPAIRRGAELARRSGGELRLVHAVSAPRPRWWTADRAGVILRETEAVSRARKMLLRRLDQLLDPDAWPGPDAGQLLRVSAGQPARVLCAEAEEFAADLLVVGPHAKRGLIDFGSTLRGLLARAPCPIWIQLEDPDPIEHVLVPIDLGIENQATLQAARDIASLLEARVTVLHCFAGPAFAYSPEEHLPGPTYTVDAWRREARDHFERVVAAFAWGDVPHESLFIEAEPVPGILDQHERSDLVVVGNHDAGAFSTALLGGTAYGVLREANRPVLVTRHASVSEESEAQDGAGS